MIAALVPLLAAQAAVEPLPLPIVLDGTCEYSEQVASHPDMPILAACNEVSVTQTNAGVAIAFSQRGWTPRMTFSGQIIGHRTEVAHLRVRKSEPLAADGTCEIFRTDGRISVVSCVAKARGRTYAANFRASRL